MMQFLLKMFRSVLNLLSAELPDSRGIFVRLESQTVWLKNDARICTWSRKLHDRACVHSTSHPADERDTAVQRLDTGHNTLLLPSGHFDMEKRWPNFCLISQAARQCMRPSARRAQCVAAGWWEGHSHIEDWTQHTFIAPFWCVVSWVIKLCVCVCVCTDSFQAGFPKRFLSVFCTFLRYFRRIPMHMQPKSVSFSSPLAYSSCLALQRICCHCHYQHVFLVSPGSVYCHLVKYGFSSGASIRSRTLPWILYERNPSTMRCSRGQLRNNGACCARENARVRFQLRTALSLKDTRLLLKTSQNYRFSNGIPEVGFSPLNIE